MTDTTTAKVIVGYVKKYLTILKEFSYKKHQFIICKKGKVFIPYHKDTGAQVLDVIADSIENAEKFGKKEILNNMRVKLFLKACDDADKDAAKKNTEKKVKNPLKKASKKVK